MNQSATAVEAGPRRSTLQESNLIQRRRRLTWKFPFHVLGRAATNFAEDRGTQLAASISYFTLFSLFPATLLAVSIFGIVLRNEEIQLRVLNAIIDFLPVQGSTVADSLRGVADLGPTVTIVSFFAALWTSGALSAAIRQALNQVFEVKRRRPLLQAKLIDFGLLPIIAVPLFGGVVLTGALRLFEQELNDRWGILDGRFAWTWDLGAFLIPLSLSFAAFALLYRFAPNRSLPFRYIAPGALFAALAFEGLKAGFTFYLESLGNYSVYGSLGSVIVLLFWVYLTANILIFGGEISAELPHVVHQEPRHGHEHLGEEPDLKRSVFNFVRGLILVAEEDQPRIERPAPEERDARQRSLWPPGEGGEPAEGGDGRDDSDRAAS